MKLISPRMLEKMKRGAEQLYKKHRESLSTATTVIRQDIAKELGLNFTETKPVVTPANDKGVVGLFKDEPKAAPVVRTPMIRVKLTDYIEALQATESGAEKAGDKK